MKYKLKDYPELKAKVEAMTAEDMLRTIICPYIWPEYPTPTKTGAVFLHPRTVPEANAMTEEINGGRENPALIVSDIERGSYAIKTARLVGLGARSMMSGWMKFKTPVVFIDYFNCNFSYTFNAVADTMINTYGFTKYTADAIVDRLTK